MGCDNTQKSLKRQIDVHEDLLCLKKHKLDKEKQNEKESFPTCIICYELIEEEETTLKCKHSFHKKCLDRWIDEDKNSCPTCRGVINPDRLDFDDSLSNDEIIDILIEKFSESVGEFAISMMNEHPGMKFSKFVLERNNDCNKVTLDMK